MNRILALGLFLFGAPLTAQQARLCDWQASAQALVEPWEENTRQFANGKVRIAAIDTVEPAHGAAYLLVLSPPYSELGERQCRIVGWTEQLGFAGLSFDALTSDYDPAVGLILQLPVRIGTPDGNFMNSARLAVTLNQSTGAMTTRLELGNE